MAAGDNLRRQCKNGIHIQSIVFKKDRFKTKIKVNNWLKKHGFSGEIIEETENTFRARQMDPDKFDENSYTTKNFTNGIDVVFACELKEPIKEEGYAPEPKPENDMASPIGTYNAEKDVIELLNADEAFSAVHDHSFEITGTNKSTGEAQTIFFDHLDLSSKDKTDEDMRNEMSENYEHFHITRNQYDEWINRKIAELTDNADIKTETAVILTDFSDTKLFFETLNLLALPEPAAEYIRANILNSDSLNLLKITDEEVLQTIDIINKKYPDAIVAIVEKPAEPENTILNAIDGLTALLEVSDEGEKASIIEAIEGLKLLL